MYYGEQRLCIGQPAGNKVTARLNLLIWPFAVVQGQQFCICHFLLVNNSITSSVFYIISDKIALLCAKTTISHNCHLTVKSLAGWCDPAHVCTSLRPVAIFLPLTVWIYLHSRLHSRCRKTRRAVKWRVNGTTVVQGHWDWHQLKARTVSDFLFATNSNLSHMSDCWLKPLKFCLYNRDIPGDN